MVHRPLPRIYQTKAVLRDPSVLSVSPSAKPRSFIGWLPARAARSSA
jgi:hypothetical protein